LSLKEIIKIRPNLVLLLILCVWGSPSSVCNAQYLAGPTIDNPIVFGWGRNLDEPGVSSYLGDIPTFAKFHFEELPSVLNEAVLTVSIQSRYNFDKTILVQVAGSVWSMDVSPSHAEWKGPIRKGDIFELRVKVRPKEIGSHLLNVTLSYESDLVFGYQLNFNIDESGKTNHLSRRAYIVPNQLPLNHLKDGLVIEYPKNSEPKVREHEGFENIFRVEPVPKLGDTADIHFSLVATNDYPEGVQLLFVATDNLDVLVLPKNWTGPIKKEQVYEGTIKIVFSEPGESRICLVPEANYYNSRKQKTDYINKLFYLSFVIDPVGKLTYVGREAKELYKTDKPPADGSVLGNKREWPSEREYIFLPLNKSKTENK